ncbi:hypothetical protein G9A89_003475 [Geosiphon pyriformis]|nr:hypothetical protein G9A89_003475 [Geosiphon pyriformis]
MKKSAKGFSANTVSKNIAFRKKRKSGVLKDVVGGSWGFETGDTTESNSVDMEKEFLIEETSVDYGEDDLLEGKNINQIPKGLKMVTKQALGKPLGKINFLDNNDDNDDVLSSGHLELPPPLKNLVNVPVQKSFALNIGLKKVTGKSSQEKLSAVRKLFSEINGFGGASTPSKFAGIIRVTFTSESSLAQASKKTGDAKILVNTNLKKPTGHSDWAVVVKKIPVETLVETVHAALSEFGSVVLIKIQLVGLWQKAMVEFAQLDQADLVAARWFILIGKDTIRVAKANSDKESWNTRDQHSTLLYTLPIGTNAHNIWDLIGSVGGKTCSTNLYWAHLSSAKCENLGHISLDCSVGKKPSPGKLAHRILSEDDKSRLASIYASCSAPISCPVSFGGVSWANIVGGSFFSPLSVRNELASFGSSLGMKPTPLVSVELNDRFATLERSLASFVEHVDKLAKRLNSPELMVFQSSPGCQPLVTLSLQNQGANIVISESSGVATGGETIAEVAIFDPSVVSKMKETLCNFSVTVMGLSAKINNAGLVPNLFWKIATCNACGINVFAKQKDVVHWHINSGNMVSIVMEMKLRSNVKLWIMNKFDGIRIFSSGLDNEFFGAGVMIIVNNSLAHHVSKIEEVLGRLFSIRLLFKSKLSVVILGLYAGASAETRFGQACEINSFIAKAANSSTFMVLGGDFNEDGSRKSASFKFCSDLGLINFFGKHSLSVVKVIDYIFVSKSLLSALAGHKVTSVSDFFNTNHNAVLVFVGLGGLLNSYLNSEHKQANKDKWKFKIKNVDANKWSHFREWFLDKFLENIVSFNDVKLFSKFFKLELLVVKLVKCLSLGQESDAVRFFKVWSNLDNKGAFKACTMFDDNESKELIIKSVLDWPFKKVVLDHLILDNELILESKEVKSAVNDIIERWTRKQVAPISLPVYCDDAFLKIMNIIKSNECLLVVKELSNRKAAGMSDILNELWKHEDA